MIYVLDVQRDKGKKKDERRTTGSTWSGPLLCVVCYCHFCML